jgi:hypothetical protein
MHFNGLARAARSRLSQNGYGLSGGLRLQNSSLLAVRLCFGVLLLKATSDVLIGIHLIHTSVFSSTAAEH